MYPVALGKGVRLFADGGDPTSLALNGCDTYTNGVVHLTYGPAKSTADR
jgi:hypothetical protein